MNKNEKLRARTCSDKITVLTASVNSIQQKLTKLAARITKALQNKTQPGANGELRELLAIRKQLHAELQGFLDEIGRYSRRQRVFGNEFMEVLR